MSKYIRLSPTGVLFTTFGVTANQEGNAAAGLELRCWLGQSGAERCRRVECSGGEALAVAGVLFTT